MPNKLAITVVVNGQPTQVEASAEASVQSLVEPALNQTGNAGQPVANWELTDQAGKPVGPPGKVEDFAGQTLFLNLKAGIGG
jgi:hypothetical protein